MCFAFSSEGFVRTAYTAHCHPEAPSASLLLLEGMTLRPRALPPPVSVDDPSFSDRPMAVVGGAGWPSSGGGTPCVGNVHKQSHP